MRMTLYGWKSDLEEGVKHFTTDLESALEEARVFKEEIVVFEVEVISQADYADVPVIAKEKNAP